MSLRDRIPKEHVPELHNMAPSAEPSWERLREESKYEVIRVRKDTIPKGLRLVEAYVTENNLLVVLGQPADDDESHNCDAMGCRFCHVIHSAQLPKGAKV